VSAVRRAAPRAVGLVVPLGVLLVWQLLSATDLLRLQFLPSPVQIGRTLVEEASTGELVADLAHTLAVVAAATGIAAVVGGGVGAALGLLPALRRRVLASVDFLRAVPAIALMPVALLVLGPRPLTELVLATYAATWPVLVSTLGGVVGVPDRLRDVAATLRLPPPSTLARVTIPASVPTWLVGARVAAIVALHVTLIAEMVISPAGLGGGLVESLQGLNPPRMWAYVVVCGVLGVALQVALRRLVRVALPGGAFGPAPGSP
jgi:ABC-type nitrate/sulfonate/bicarbonate transport system permease component